MFVYFAYNNSLTTIELFASSRKLVDIPAADHITRDFDLESIQKAPPSLISFCNLSTRKGETTSRPLVLTTCVFRFSSQEFVLHVV